MPRNKLLRGYTITEKLLENRKIDEKTGCWLWTGTTTATGYGTIGINYKHHQVHRLAWQEFVGPIVNQINHKLTCLNHHCFNPEHLYDGTQQENIIDKYTLNKRKRRTHCINGHERTKENLSGECCKICARNRSAESYKKKTNKKGE